MEFSIACFINVKLLKSCKFLKILSKLPPTSLHHIIYKKSRRTRVLRIHIIMALKLKKFYGNMQELF